MPNPLRIYVLHHPDSQGDKGLASVLTNRIYDWFRLSSLEGIPVYVRSLPKSEEDWPDMPYRAKAKKPDDKKCLEYIVPLVDAHMVRDPRWHGYLSEVAKLCAESDKELAKEWGMKMFPVALDSTAFNLPDGISRMNFIRHGASLPRVVVTKGAPDEEEQKRKQDEQLADDVEETLKHLTAALAHDLSGRLFDVQARERFKIFISYARADSAEEAKTLRNYIQGQTQCLVFFDENDIGFGADFGSSIDKHVDQISQALIVLNSDSYADRPWCRHEIEHFTQPRLVKGRQGKTAGGEGINVFLPLLVVDNMRGPQMTRVVPELAQAPIVRWAPGRERLCFSTLMREVLLGLRDVLEARLLSADHTKENAVVVNRLPGPLALARLPGVCTATVGNPARIHHPGHGLPFTELQLLGKTFPNIRFEAFRDLNYGMPELMKAAFQQMQTDSKPPLQGKVITVSTGHHREDLARTGYLPQHQDEALIHLLRPLIRLGASLMYGGRPPKQNMGASAAASGADQRNITLTLMQLLRDERQVNGGSKKREYKLADGPLLYNPSSWPDCADIKPNDEAAWINACHIERVLPENAGLPPWHGEAPSPKAPPTIGQRRYSALVLTEMRRMLTGGFKCNTPGKLRRKITPEAFVFIGGATQRFKSVMPGVMEELYFAVKLGKGAPIYLMGGLGGATAIIAKALLAEKDASRPPELTMAYYRSLKYPDHANYEALIAELEPKEVQQIDDRFEELWTMIASVRDKGDLTDLFGNGLSDEDNRNLLEKTSTTWAVGLIWKGLSEVHLSHLGQTLSAHSATPAKKKRSHSDLAC